FAQSPSGATGGSAFSSQPIVEIQDNTGTAIAGDTTSVTLAVSGGATPLTCTANTVAAVDGVATFAGCKIDPAASGYTLTATANGFVSVLSDPFDVGAGPA